MISQQQPDGSWVPAEPTPFTDTVDWEIRDTGKHRWAVAYWHADQIGHVPPGRFFRLRLALANRRLRKAYQR